jgi:aldose 1-epimerase
MAGRALSGEQWVIESGDHLATIVEVGGGLREYSVDGRDVVFGYRTDELCPGAAGAQLVPWPNRTGDGHYRYDGAEYQLPLTEPGKHNAIHGLARWQPWRKVAGTADSVTVACELPAQPGWPWPLSLTTRWSVSRYGLRVEHTATNLAERPAPFGLGCHPYLTLPGALADWSLHIPAGVALRSDERSLPVAEVPVAESGMDFSAPRRIGDAVVDMAYTDLRRNTAGTVEAVLSAPAGTAVVVWADEAFGWLQAFTGDTLSPARRRRAVAVEPMTCPPDALRTGRDLVTLVPGETWRAAWGIRPGE